MPVKVERALEREADKRGLEGEERDRFVYGTMRKRLGWKPKRELKKTKELAALLDQIIEFASPWRPGYKRPSVFSYGKGEERRGAIAKHLGDSTIGAYFPSSSMEDASPHKKGGLIIYPNTGASKEIISKAPYMKRIYGTAENMSKSIRRHELIHSLRGHVSSSSLANAIEERKVLATELLGKHGRKLGTPFVRRLLYAARV